MRLVRLVRSGTRQTSSVRAALRALRELRRICVGPIVVSFVCGLAWDAVLSGDV